MRFKDRVDIFLLIAGSFVWDILPDRVTDHIADWSANSPIYERWINR